MTRHSTLLPRDTLLSLAAIGLFVAGLELGRKHGMADAPLFLSRSVALSEARSQSAKVVRVLTMRNACWERCRFVMGRLDEDDPDPCAFACFEEKDDDGAD